MVLDAVPSPHSKRNYATALDDLFAFCASWPPLSRFCPVLIEWDSTHTGIAANVVEGSPRRPERLFPVLCD
jgi:hypothetical protein